MLNVTEKAAAVLDESLEASRENDSDVFRLTRAADGLGIALSEEREGDQTVQCEDRTVLVLEPEVSEALDSATLDAIDSPQGPRLSLQSPGEQ